MSTRRNRRARRGFTIIEVLIAVTILIVGVLGMIGTSAAITKMLSRGNRSNRAAFLAQERLERLMATPCQLLANGTSTQAGVYSLAWTVTTPAAGTGKRIRMISTYPAVLRRNRADTTEATVLCIR
ncbi:MAG TPA: prepilin-type N-terminal cleavage/methylation domain-containing protein [Gemmatimonadaceae bacterium]|nr:prepilin-type N-terminal cleavage/methylation domain-containing protein [Gemmatimonadaceae bacterium]